MIDLSISSANIFSRIGWTITLVLHSSSHFPQIINLVPSLSNSPKTLPLKRHFSRTNCEYYCHLLDFSAVFSSKSTDDAFGTITEEIFSAAYKAIPCTKLTTLNGFFRHRVPRWNTKCQRLIREKCPLFNKCRRYLTQGNLTLFKIARTKARRAIFESKRDSWRHYIS